MEERKFRILFITGVLAICALSIFLSVYDKLVEKDPGIIGIGNVTTIEEEREDTYTELKSNFNSIFSNTLNTKNNNLNINKEDSSKELLYTKTEAKENKLGIYDVNISIPYININSNLARNINYEIEQTFKIKADSIISKNEAYTVYSVSYAGYINNNILSIVIQATLKENSNAQRVIIKTYNYNIDEDKLIDLNEAISLKQLKNNEVQNKITKEILKAAREAETLKGLYEVYSRDTTSKMYKIENTENFFLGANNYLYILYAYGNNEYTSELDMVIF